MKNVFIYILFLLFSIHVYAQKPELRSCDFLVGKPNDFLYSESDLIYKGVLSSEINMFNEARYEVTVLDIYKGQSMELNFFSQAKNSNWFRFTKGDTLWFIVFKNYEDKVFSPCILFGKNDNMAGVIKIAMNNCMEPKRENIGACERSLNEVCGCTGVTYGNACEASIQGVKYWRAGRCNNAPTAPSETKSLPPPAVIWTGE